MQLKKVKINLIYKNIQEKFYVKSFLYFSKKQSKKNVEFQLLKN